MARRTKTPENSVKDACIEWLVLHDAIVIRINSGSMVGYHKGARWFFWFCSWFARGCGQRNKGVSDIIVNWRGRAVAIECKAGKNQTTIDQEEFLDQWAKRGGIALVVRSVDEMAKYLEDCD